MKKRKKKKVKERSWVAEMMIFTTRFKAYIDRKKEGLRKACRQKVAID